MAQAQTKEYAHELIDRMAPGQVSVVVPLLEVLIDPVARALANAPYDDEPIGDEEKRDVAASKEWLKENDSIPNSVVLAEIGLTEEDFERMGREPLGPNSGSLR